MRYLILTYFQKPDGKIDESMAVSKNLKTRDLQCANVILDFKKLEVVKASMNGEQVPKDFDKIVTYYMQFYEKIITRLFNENGYEVNLEHTQTTENTPVQPQETAAG
jgi:hypothetical protein